MKSVAVVFFWIAIVIFVGAAIWRWADSGTFPIGTYNLFRMGGALVLISIAASLLVLISKRDKSD